MFGIMKRFASFAIAVGLAVAVSVTLFANTISVTGFAADGSDAEGAKMLLYARTTQYPAIDTQFIDVYPFIDGRAVQFSEDAPWQGMKMIYDAAYDQYWTNTVATTPGWHSVQYLARTKDRRWVWDQDAHWIYIDG